MNRINAYNKYNSILLSLQKVMIPTDRPSRVRVILNHEEFELYRKDKIYVKYLKNEFNK